MMNATAGALSNKVIITCAVTGNLTKPEQSPYLPITPGQIVDACLEAASVGAAIVHIHVREPANGAPSMELSLYREVVYRLRAKNPALILNVTTGPGGRFVPSPHDPKVAAPGSTLVAPERRVEHIDALRPDICTLDLNTMNSGAEVVINTPTNVRRMAKIIQNSEVRPEIELFDSGDIALLHDLLSDGTLSGPLMCSFVMGAKYGFQPSPETVLYARNLLPAGSQFTAIGIGRSMFKMAAQSFLAGGHVRVGLEDSIYLSKGKLAPSNASLVEKVSRMVQDLGGEIATTSEARSILQLSEPNSKASPALFNA